MHTPDHPAAPAPSQMARFQQWLADQRGLRFDGYEALWEWSTTDLPGFWGAVWDYFGLQSPEPPTTVLGQRDMPGAQWFPGTRLN